MLLLRTGTATKLNSALPAEHARQRMFYRMEIKKRD